VNPLRPLTDRQVFLFISAMSLGAALAAIWVTRSTNPLRGDSAEYLYFDPSRSVGYPAFLSLVRLVTGEVALAVPVQALLLAGSLLLLAWNFHWMVRRPAYTIGFQFLLLANAGMWLTSAFLMTEALSTALVALWCSQALRMIKGPRPVAFGMLVATSCLATMVRPSLAALFIGTAVLSLFVHSPRDRARALAIVAAGLSASWAATPFAQFLVHGSTWTTSPFARGVLQHTLYCDPHALPKDEDSQFVEQHAKPVRNYIDTAPARIQEQLRREYSTPLRFGLIIPVLGRRHHLQTRSEVDPYLRHIAIERVADNPGCYARAVANEYLRLAAFDTDPTLEDGREAATFIRRHRPVEIPQYPLLPGDDRLARRAALEVHNQPAGLNPPHQKLDVVAKVPFLALLPLRLLHGAAAIIGLMSLVALTVRRRLEHDVQTAALAAASMGASLHGILAITAIVEIGFYRYLVPCWPLVCTVAALAAVSVARGAEQRRHSSFAMRPAAEPIEISAYE
jgi:hypothetical protein